MSAAAWEDALRRAGYNVLHLQPEEIAHDLFTDAQHGFTDSGVAEAGAQAWTDDHARVDLEPLLRDAFGAGLHFVVTGTGRAAEMALASALPVERPVVLTHGLFSSTTRALATRGARLEPLPLAAPRGTADVDLDALERRLAQGGVTIVYLEVANNALCGWPLSEENLAGARRLCDAHSARLWLDATRLLTNGVLLGVDPWPHARRMLTSPHAFTIACSKEFLVPRAALCASTEAALIGRAALHAFQHGTDLTSVADRAAFAAGVNRVTAHAEPVAERARLVRELHARLVRRGTAVPSPPGGHAIFVEVDRAIPARFGSAATAVLLAQVFATSGIRAQLAKWGEQPLLRFALPIARVDARSLDAIADGIAEAAARLDAARGLRALPGQEQALPFAVRYAPA